MVIHIHGVVSVAIATRMAYRRACVTAGSCVTTGSKGGQLGFILGDCRVRRIENFPVPMSGDVRQGT